MGRKEYPLAYTDAPVYPALTGYKMACCDCCMVHNIRVEIVRVKDFNAPLEDDEVLTDPDLRVRWYVTRNNRATGQLRRYRGKRGD